MKKNLSDSSSSPHSMFIFIFLIPFLLLGCLVDRTLGAPAVEGDDVDGGCYYMFNHYGEGDRIFTNEPCLNCTCHNSMLMCYLRVCPFTKPIGQDCTIEKKPDQCCPVISCPEVPVSLVTPSTLTTTTVSTTSLATVPEMSTELAHYERGCNIDGKFYHDGAQVEGDPRKPCELCYCIRNKTACVMQECILHVEGCQPVFQPGVCCPVRYRCDYLALPDETTTVSGLITTTIKSIFTSTPVPGGCVREGEYYADGSQIPGATGPCEHCYCMRGEIVCAVQECGAPLENEGGNCTAIAPPPGMCCPEKYSCDGEKVPSDESSTTLSPQDVESSAGVTQSDVQQPSHDPTVEEEGTTVGSIISDDDTISEKVGTVRPTQTAEEDQQQTTISPAVDDQDVIISSTEISPPKPSQQPEVSPPQEDKLPVTQQPTAQEEDSSVGGTTQSPSVDVTEPPKEPGSFDIAPQGFPIPDGVSEHPTEVANDITTVTPTAVSTSEDSAVSDTQDKDKLSDSTEGPSSIPEAEGGTTTRPETSTEVDNLVTSSTENVLIVSQPPKSTERPSDVEDAGSTEKSASESSTESASSSSSEKPEVTTLAGTSESDEGSVDSASTSSGDVESSTEFSKLPSEGERPTETPSTPTEQPPSIISGIDTPSAIEPKEPSTDSPVTESIPAAIHDESGMKDHVVETGDEEPTAKPDVGKEPSSIDVPSSVTTSKPETDKGDEDGEKTTIRPISQEPQGAEGENEVDVGTTISPIAPSEAVKPSTEGPKVEDSTSVPTASSSSPDTEEEKKQDDETPQTTIGSISPESSGVTSSPEESVVTTKAPDTESVTQEIIPEKVAEGEVDTVSAVTPESVTEIGESEKSTSPSSSTTAGDGEVVGEMHVSSTPEPAESLSMHSSTTTTTTSSPLPPGSEADNEIADAQDKIDDDASVSSSTPEMEGHQPSSSTESIGGHTSTPESSTVPSSSDGESDKKEDEKEAQAMEKVTEQPLPVAAPGEAIDQQEEKVTEVPSTVTSSSPPSASEGAPTESTVEDVPKPTETVPTDAVSDEASVTEVTPIVSSEAPITAVSSEGPSHVSTESPEVIPTELPSAASTDAPSVGSTDAPAVAPTEVPAESSTIAPVIGGDSASIPGDAESATQVPINDEPETSSDVTTPAPSVSVSDADNKVETIGEIAQETDRTTITPIAPDQEQPITTRPELTPVSTESPTHSTPSSSDTDVTSKPVVEETAPHAPIVEDTATEKVDVSVEPVTTSQPLPASGESGISPTPSVPQEEEDTTIPTASVSEGAPESQVSTEQPEGSTALPVVPTKPSAQDQGGQTSTAAVELEVSITTTPKQEVVAVVDESQPPVEGQFDQHDDGEGVTTVSPVPADSVAGADSSDTEEGKTTVAPVIPSVSTEGEDLSITSKPDNASEGQETTPTSPIVGGTDDQAPVELTTISPVDKETRVKPGASGVLKPDETPIAVQDDKIDATTVPPSTSDDSDVTTVASSPQGQEEQSDMTTSTPIQDSEPAEIQHDPSQPEVPSSSSSPSPSDSDSSSGVTTELPQTTTHPELPIASDDKDLKPKEPQEEEGQSDSLPTTVSTIPVEEDSVVTTEPPKVQADSDLNTTTPIPPSSSKETTSANASVPTTISPSSDSDIGVTVHPSIAPEVSDMKDVEMEEKVGHEVSTTTTAPSSQESEDEMSHVPGEGHCFVEGKTYKNGSSIPPTTPCHIVCACQNSIVHCLLVHCNPPPSDTGDCKPIYKQGVCCPTYDCEDSRGPPVTVTPGPAFINETFVTVTPETPSEETSASSGDDDTPVSDGHTTLATISSGESSESSGTPSVEDSQGEKTTDVDVAQPVHDHTNDSPEDSVSHLTSTTPASSLTNSILTTPVIPSESEQDLLDSVNATGGHGGHIVVEASSEVPLSGITSSSIRPDMDDVLGEHHFEDEHNATSEEVSPHLPPGSLYPVTTTTTVTPSTASWPYPTSTTSPSVMSAGACLFDSRVYMSAQQIPRDDPCDFCFCFRGDIICLQQSCPPPIPGCYEEPIPGFCCPRYECPVGNGNVTTQPPMFPPSYYHNQLLNGMGAGGNPGAIIPSVPSGPGCEVQGEYYESGQIITSTSGPCLECRCGMTGMMECDPRECQPEPMLRKMIAAITTTSR